MFSKKEISRLDTCSNNFHRLIEEAIHNYRSLLLVIETKATVNVRKVRTDL